MSISPDQTTQPNDDHAFAESVEEARRDWDRLRYVHSPTWSLNLYGMVEWSCSCAYPGPRNSQANDEHLLAVVRKVRGPVRGPRK